MCYLQIHISFHIYRHVTTHYDATLCLAPEAAKQLLDNLLGANATRLFPLFAFLRNGRRNEMTQVATHHTTSLQIGPIIVHLQQPSPVIVLVVATSAPSATTTPL